MTKFLLRSLPLLLVISAGAAHAQFYKFHGGSLSAGGTGQFTTILTANPRSATYTSRNSAGVPITSTATNQRQDTTMSAGFVGKFQFHPVAWAGIELNYGYTHYSERYTFNAPTPLAVGLTTGAHEATAAYLFHPKRIPFQPYLGMGGGAINFSARTANNQWRTAGLLETGFDIPVKNTRMGFRIGARSLYYRSPNFSTPALSTRSWRVTAQPEISTYYRF